MNNIFLALLGFLIWACLGYFIIRFIAFVLRANRLIDESNKQAKIARINTQNELKNLTTDKLRELLNKNLYLNDLKSTRTLREFFDYLENKREKEIIKSKTEKSFYRLLADAEYENGHKGRPEAIDSALEIWDILKELSTR